jgi:hypothetical protein
MSGNGNILERISGRAGNGLSEQANNAEATEEDVGAFGILRGIRDRAIMLELRKRTGDILAIGYSWINRMQFNSAEITLYCGDDKIIIKGRNLNSETRPQLRLFEGLTKHKVSFIQEADQSAALHAEMKTVVVESIEW